MASRTRILGSFFHTPTETAKKIFTVVLRAGHVRAGPEFRVERRVCPGHDLLLCVGGRGFISWSGRSFPVLPGQVAWLNGHHPHAHWSDPNSPWELLWVRIDGATLDQIFEELSLRESPVIRGLNQTKVRRIFRRILRFMGTRPPAMEALLHAEVDKLVACFFECQIRQARASRNSALVNPALDKAIEQMSLYYHRHWRVEDLARVAGMSISHFYRCFRQQTGLTPIAWLRRERLSQAQRRLVESNDAVKEVAEQVGYSDQFYFSRDFKRFVGVSPSQYRH